MIARKPERRGEWGAALTALLAAALATGVSAAADPPLLAHAATLSFVSMPYEEQYRARLEQARRALDLARPPEGRSCARSLGAARFAALHDALGEALAGLGQYTEALEAYARAVDCSPRDPSLRASLAAQYFHLGQHAGALLEIERGLRISPQHYRLNSLRAQIDYVEGRWREAAHRFAEIAQRTRDGDQAAYWTILAWLAGRRAGEPDPKLAVAFLNENWPRPIMRVLRGARDEAALLETILAEPDEMRRREMLCEALFYVGQLRLIEGDRGLARRHLAAVVNLKVLYFIEHHLSQAMLARMREREEGVTAKAQ